MERLEEKTKEIRENLKKIDKPLYRKLGMFSYDRFIETFEYKLSDFFKNIPKMGLRDAIKKDIQITLWDLYYLSPIKF